MRQAKRPIDPTHMSQLFARFARGIVLQMQPDELRAFVTGHDEAEDRPAARKAA